MAELVAADGCSGADTVPGVVAVLSAILESVAERNDAAARRGRGPPQQHPQPGAAAFQGLTKPGISVRSYLERISRYANCSPSCFVVAYIYLDRFLQRHRPAVALDSFNVHRFLITSVLAAVKFMEDIYYNNAYFAKVGGISLVEMNYLEVDFLFGIGFDLNVTPLIFTSYCCILQREVHALIPSTPPPPPPPPPPPSRLVAINSCCCCCLNEEESTTSACQHNKQLAAV